MPSHRSIHRRPWVEANITPDQSRLHCGVQSRERPVVISRRLGAPQIGPCRNCYAVLALDRDASLNADSRILHALVLKVDAFQHHSVLVMGAISLSHTGLLLIEGVGLWLEASWIAYLTVISMSLLLSFELYEVLQQVSALRIGMLLLSLVIAPHLVSQLKQHTLHSGFTVHAGVVGAQHD